MKIITKAIERALPKLYTHEATPAAQVPIVFKLFNPTGAGTWYITEGDLATGTLFGLCHIAGLEAELGYVNLNELLQFRGRFGLKIERDLHYRGTLADAMRAHGLTP